MSKPRYYWYNIVKGLIKKSNTIEEKSIQSSILSVAMLQAEKETLQLPNGELRMKAIKALLIDQTKTLKGVCEDVNYQERTVQGWISSYVNLVGKKAGY